MAVPFQHGFNDRFQVYAATASADLAAQRAQDAHCSHVRFDVGWDSVEQNGPSSSTAPAWVDPFGQYNYENLRATMGGRGPINAHPVVVGCPTSWIPRSERNPCRGVYPANPADDWTVSWYPRTAWAWQQYANFCVTVLKYFDASPCAWVDNVEIWNEPNAGNSDTMIPLVSSFSGMLGTTISTVAAANSSGSFTHPMGVISGGLLMDYSQGLWKNYLASFMNQAGAFAVGIHPYDTRDHTDETSSQAANGVAGRIQDLYLQATLQCSNDLWVTETGCSARAAPWGPWGQSGQSQALATLAGAGGFFAGQPRCKGVFIHRMYPNDENAGGKEAAGKTFYAYSTLNYGSWTPRTAHTMLGLNW